MVLRGRIDEVDDERSYAKHEHKNHLLEKRTSDVTLQQKHLPYHITIEIRHDDDGKTEED